MVLAWYLCILTGYQLEISRAEMGLSGRWNLRLWKPTCNYLQKHPTPQPDSSVFILCLIGYESQRFDGLNDANSQRPRLLSPLVCDLVFLALLSSVTRCKQNTLPHGRGRWRREHFTLERRYVSMNQNQSILSTWIWVMFCYFRATQENWALLFPWSHQHIKRNPHVFLKVGIWIL